MYLSQIDVGLTPYADSHFNRASFPLKTLEYLAAGLPVVSTDLPATRWLQTSHIRIASGPGDVVAAVREAAKETADDSARVARRQFAARHSWAVRAAEVAELLRLPTVTAGRTKSLDRMEAL